MTQSTAIINELGNNKEVINRKIDLATTGLRHFISKYLTQDVSPENALTMSEVLYSICKFVRDNNGVHMKDIFDAGNNDIHNHGGKISQSGNVEQSISQSNSRPNSQQAYLEKRELPSQSSNRIS